MLMTISMHMVALYTVVGLSAVVAAGRLLLAWAVDGL